MKQSNQLIIKEIPLKQLIEYFDKQAPLIIHELGDTLHPSHGFIDQSFFDTIQTVNNFLNIDYDFQGLVSFVADIDAVHIYFDNQNREFVLSGDTKKLKILQQK
ncbi:MAG: hypothetical protein KBD15_03480 [Candidatus Magasanikbacteria bacterium]|jgi:hypothetical protein|nr:hypothetical protein [Candidatus Magasanikbacteria bacterium]